MAEIVEHREIVKDTLTPEQQKAIEALAAGATKDMAAGVAGRSVRTIDRWIAEDPAFSHALRAANDEAIANASRRLNALLDKAITALEKMIEKPGVSDKDRLRAINTVLFQANKFNDEVMLIERIQALEEMLNKPWR